MISISGRKYTRSGFYICLFFVFMISVCSQVFAENIQKVIVDGYRQGPDISDITSKMRGDLSPEEIRSFAALITERYLEAGYTGSGVREIAAGRNGVLKLVIHEAHITGINIKGAGNKRKQIKEILFPAYGELYNTYTIEKRQKKASSLPGVSSVKIKPVRLDSGHVFLEVMVAEKKGEFYGGIMFDMFYGTTPRLGYMNPFGDVILDVSAEAGYRDGEFKKAAGYLALYFNLNRAHFLCVRAGAVRFIEEWQSLSSEYSRKMITPSVGIIRMMDYGRMSIFVKEDVIFTDDYSSRDGTFYDTGIEAAAEISDRKFLLDKRDASWLKFSITSGYCDIEENAYASTSFRAGTSFQLLPRFRLVPVMDIFYTTITERLYHEYVFDSMLPGFNNDFTASAWKNSLRLDAEFEFIRGFMYAGPIAGAGYFRDEKEEWKYKTATGLKTDFVFNNVVMNIVFAWDASGSPSDGGLFLAAEGSF